MSKLTDAEILKALKRCSINKTCIDCPLDEYEGEEGCVVKVKEEAFDLINRQKAEIERLTDSNRRLKDDMCMMLNNDNGSEQIKSEARKELAERLCKGRVSNDPIVIAVKCELEEMEAE